MSRIVDVDKIPHLGRYILAMARTLDKCGTLSARQIATKFLMELDLCDPETPSPFVLSQLPYQQMLDLMKKIEAMLIEQHLDPGKDDFIGYPHEKRRLEIACEIFSIIVEAMYPLAMQDDEDDRGGKLEGKDEDTTKLMQQKPPEQVLPPSFPCPSCGSVALRYVEYTAIVYPVLSVDEKTIRVSADGKEIQFECVIKHYLECSACGEEISRDSRTIEVVS